MLALCLVACAGVTSDPRPAPDWRATDTDVAAAQSATGPLAIRVPERTPRPGSASRPESAPGVPSDRNRRLGAAAVALGDDRPDLAVAELLPLIALDEGDALAHFLMGVARLAQFRLEEARHHLQLADRLEPDDPATMALLGRAVYDLDGPDPARPLLERVVELAPDDPDHWSNLGLVDLELGRFGEAHDAFMSALTLDPAHTPGHRGMARLYALAQEPVLAERAWRTALSLDPTDAVAWVSLGHTLREQQSTAKALEAYREAARLLPGDPWVAANVGSALLALGRPREAKEPLLDAVAGLDEFPTDQARALANLGRVLAATGDLEGAELSLTEAVELDPRLGTAHADLGAMWLDRGRNDEARPALERAFDLGELPPDLVYELVCLHEADDDAEAARRVALALFVPSDDPALLVQRARLQLDSRDPLLHDAAAAETLLHQLLAGPLRGHGDGWVLLAQALVERGALVEAVRALDEALQMSNDGLEELGLREWRDRLAARLRVRGD